MVARGQFGHHAAIQGMQVDLAEQPVGQQAAVRVVDRHRGLVAAGFDAQHGPRAGTTDCLFAFIRGQALYFRATPGSSAGFFRPEVEKTSAQRSRTRKRDILTPPSGVSSAPAKKRAYLTEVRRREFYEKPTQERKRKRAAAVKRQLKRTAREANRRRRLY